jgi:hypothetical protein
LSEGVGQIADWAVKCGLSGFDIRYPAIAGAKPMSVIQLFSIVFLTAAIFTLASYILINNFLMEWNDEY